MSPTTHHGWNATTSTNNRCPNNSCSSTNNTVSRSRTIIVPRQIWHPCHDWRWKCHPCIINWGSVLHYINNKWYSARFSSKRHRQLINGATHNLPGNYTNLKICLILLVLKQENRFYSASFGVEVGLVEILLIYQCTKCNYKLVI